MNSCLPILASIIPKVVKNRMTEISFTNVLSIIKKQRLLFHSLISLMASVVLSAFSWLFCVTRYILHFSVTLFSNTRFPSTGNIYCILWLSTKILKNRQLESLLPPDNRFNPTHVTVNSKVFSVARSVCLARSSCQDRLMQLLIMQSSRISTPLSSLITK